VLNRLINLPQNQCVKCNPTDSDAETIAFIRQSESAVATGCDHPTELRKRGWSASLAFWPSKHATLQINHMVQTRLQQQVTCC